MAVTQYQIFCRYYNGDLNRPVTNQTPCEWVSKAEYNALQLYCNNPQNRAMYEDLDAHLRGKKTDEHGAVRWQKDFSQLENECYENFQRMKELEVLKKKNLVAYEVISIEPLDHLYNDQGSKKRAKVNRDLAHWATIAEESKVSNPKYDMIFMYDGLAQVKGPVCSGGSMQEDYGQFEDSGGNNVYCMNPEPQDKHQQPYIYYDNMKRVTFDIWFEHSIHASLASAMTKANELVNIMGKHNVKIGKVVPLDKYIEIV